MHNDKNMSRSAKYKALVIGLAILLVLLGCGVWLLHEMWMGTEQLPLSLKLADCTNNVVKIHLKIPTGHAYQLELKGAGIMNLTGEGSKSSYNFSGRLRVFSDGSLCADMPIGSDKAWLTPSGFVLTGVGSQNTNVPPLWKFIQANMSYDFEISFEPSPPSGSSIWLYCLESRQDMRK